MLLTTFDGLAPPCTGCCVVCIVPGDLGAHTISRPQRLMTQPLLGTSAILVCNSSGTVPHRSPVARVSLTHATIFAVASTCIKMMQPPSLATHSLVHVIDLILSCSVVSLPLLAEDPTTFFESHLSACQQDALHHHPDASSSSVAVPIMPHVIRCCREDDRQKIQR